MKDFLSAREIIILEEAHKAARHKRQADRIKPILLLNGGYTYETTSHILRLDDTTTADMRKSMKKAELTDFLETIITEV
jgi:hypothetical protein